MIHSHTLQGELLDLKRQLRATQQKEQRQQVRSLRLRLCLNLDPAPRPSCVVICSGAAGTGCVCGLQATLQGMALDDSMAASLWGAIEGHGEGGVVSTPTPQLAGLAGREAVLRQSKQLRWRCQELQALEEKVRSLQAEAQRENRPVNTGGT